MLHIAITFEGISGGGHPPHLMSFIIKTLVKRIGGVGTTFKHKSLTKVATKLKANKHDKAP